MKSDEYKRLHHDMTQATFATEVMFGALITGLITSETLKPGEAKTALNVAYAATVQRHTENSVSATIIKRIFEVCAGALGTDPEESPKLQ